MHTVASIQMHIFQYETRLPIYIWRIFTSGRVYADYVGGTRMREHARLSSSSLSLLQLMQISSFRAWLERNCRRKVGLYV